MTHTTRTEEHAFDTTQAGLIDEKNTKYKKESSAVHTWCDGPHNSARSETALWVAVITQAMMDALNRSRHPENLYHKQAAIQWLTGNSKDFFLVCLLADMDPDYVRRKAKRSLVSPIAWRAAPGQGKRYGERRAYRQRMKKIRPFPAGEEDTPRPPAAPVAKTCEVIIGPWRA